MTGTPTLRLALIASTLVAASSLLMAASADAQWLAERVPIQPSVLPLGPTLSPAASDLVPLFQERRLPVYDDAGELISYDEIQALVDPSGSKGATWGFLLGGLAGIAIGAAVGKCGGVRGGYRYYCSPREDSLRSILPVGLGFTFGFAMGWVWWNVDRTTFDEAADQIRQQRRIGR